MPATQSTEPVASSTDTDTDSTAASSPSSVTPDVTCAYCGGARDPYDSIEGSYCSERCYYRERGERILNQIEANHTLCATCFGKIKDIEPIPDSYCEYADGYQHKTEQTEHVIDEFSGPGETNHRIQSTRWGCDCGCVNPRDVHAEIQNANLKTCIENCLYALYYLHERGAIPFPPSRQDYFDALRKHWRDAAYAIGRAVYADTPE